MDEKLAEYLERVNFHDYLDQQLDTAKLIRQNLIAGVARGFGIAIGGTVVLSIVLSLFAAVKHFFF